MPMTDAEWSHQRDLQASVAICQPLASRGVMVGSDYAIWALRGAGAPFEVTDTGFVTGPPVTPGRFVRRREIKSLDGWLVSRDEVAAEVRYWTNHARNA